MTIETINAYPLQWPAMTADWGWFVHEYQRQRDALTAMEREP